MSRNLEYASMTDSLQHAVRKMTDKNVSSLVVIDMNNIPIGLVTERDIVRKACSREQLNCSTFRVSEIMTSSPVTIDSEATPEEAAELFLKNKIRHLLVIDKNTRKASLISNFFLKIDKRDRYIDSQIKSQETISKLNRECLDAPERLLIHLQWETYTS